MIVLSNRTYKRLLRVKTIVLLALYGLIACSSGSDSNPQTSQACDPNCGGSGVGVNITSPQNNDDIPSTDTILVTGTSVNAESITFMVDDIEYSVNGLENWDVVIESGSLEDIAHRFTARANDNDGSTAEDSILITVFPAEPIGTEDFEYFSSVDNVSMDSRLYVPTALRNNPSAPATPLIIWLHGGGGLGVISAELGAALEQRNWIGIAPHGRRWPLAQMGCEWNTAAHYVNGGPDVGPGETDIFDAIDWAKNNYNIDESRIYLTGFSFGGRGTYGIGLRNPDYFAAIAPTGPASDMHEVFAFRPEPPECKEGMVGGAPGDSLVVDTTIKMTSPRFLIENAYNLPVFHAHGMSDNSAYNHLDQINGDHYLHGFHMVGDDVVVMPFNNFTGCHDKSAQLYCFPDTPTLSQLRRMHPSAYDWAHLFTPTPHNRQVAWTRGAPVPDAQMLGVQSTEHNGLMGLIEFFSMHQRVTNPDTVVFKSYTDEHRQSHWLLMDVAQPWQDAPGAVRAIRDEFVNRLDVEVNNLSALTFDLEAAGLNLLQTLTVDIELLEVTINGSDFDFDKTLANPQPVTMNLVLKYPSQGFTNILVEQNGVDVSSGASMQNDIVTIPNLVIDNLQSIVIRLLP